jgi:hypothetical protein
MLFEISNEGVGISAIISESYNPRHKYHLVYMDDDANEVVSSVFGDNYDRLVTRALEFVRGVKLS